MTMISKRTSNTVHNSNQLVKFSNENFAVKKAEIQICPSLTREQVIFIKAAQSESISEINKGKLLKIILEIVSIAYTELNQAPAGKNEEEQNESIRLLSKLIYADLLHYFPQVTAREIFFAVKNGIRREYGDFYGFSVVTVHHFVKKYLDDEERQDAFKRQKRFLAEHKEPQKQPTSEEIEALNRKGLKLCYETWLRCGEVYDYGDYVYNYVSNRGFIKLSKEEEDEIYQKAVRLVQCEKMKERMRIPLAFLFNKHDESDFREKYTARCMILAKFFESLGKNCKWEFLDKE